MSRVFVCERCGQERVAAARGRLPRVCSSCSSKSQQRRDQAAVRQSLKAARAEVERLRAKVTELEAAMSFDQEAARRALLLLPAQGETPRHVVGRAVRRLALARGRAETREALLGLAAACRSWARTLAVEYPAKDGGS